MRAPPKELQGMYRKTWFAGTPMDAPRDEDGKLAGESRGGKGRGCGRVGEWVMGGACMLRGLIEG